MGSEKSFTVIELLVVVAMIGLIASIILVQVQGARERARIASALDFSHTLQNTLGADAVGVWRFEETGNTAFDNSGYGNNGTIYGTIPTDGILGSALTFNGSSDYVSVGIDAPEYNFTIELWIKTSSPNVGVFHIAGNPTPCSNGHDRHFYLSNGNACHRVWQGSGWCTNKKIGDGKWHHWILSVETGIGQKVFIDGQLVGTFSYDHSDFDWQTHAIIGHSCDAANDYFNGTIDEVKIYSKALTAAQIKAHYLAGLKTHFSYSK